MYHIFGAQNKCWVEREVAVMFLRYWHKNSYRQYKSKIDSCQEKVIAFFFLHKGIKSVLHIHTAAGSTSPSFVFKMASFNQENRGK